MAKNIFHNITGAERLNSPLFILSMLGIAVFLGLLVVKMGIIVGAAIIALPMVLYGVNAVFKDAGLAIFAALIISFYSDAGQFGSSQAYVAAVCFISALAPTLKMKKKILLVVIGVITFIGFGISGTRGALAVPAVAGFMFLIFSKQVKILVLGVLVARGAFYVLKHTKAFQSIEQVARMRSGLSDDNPSLEVRLNNQRYFYKLLKTRPVGAGIGTAGYWADKYNPHGKWAVPTDSYYARIWAETGIVGICLHFIFFGYIFGRGGHILWNLKNQELRFKMIALFGGFAGVLATSYGNAVYSQLPSAMVMIISLPMIFLAPLYDKILAQEEIKEKVKRNEELTYEEQVLLVEELK